MAIEIKVTETPRLRPLGRENTKEIYRSTEVGCSDTTGLCASKGGGLLVGIGIGKAWRWKENEVRGKLESL